MKELLKWRRKEGGRVYVGRLKSERLSGEDGPLRIFYTHPDLSFVTGFTEIRQITDLFRVEPTGRLAADLFEVLSEEFMLTYKSRIGYTRLLEEANKKRLELIQQQELQ